MQSVNSLITQLDTHTHTRTHTHPVGLLWTGDRLVAEAATYTTQHKSNRQISMASAALEPAMPPIKRPQTYGLDRTACGIGFVVFTYCLLNSAFSISGYVLCRMIGFLVSDESGKTEHLYSWHSCFIFERFWVKTSLHRHAILTSVLSWYSLLPPGKYCTWNIVVTDSFHIFPIRWLYLFRVNDWFIGTWRYIRGPNMAK